MRFFFVAYCFGDLDGEAQIGVYKRGLRLAMELRGQGHEVVFFCTGRQAYHDDLTAAAEEQLTFVDIPFTVADFEEASRIRARFLEEISRIAPDVIVIGEAPLAGTLLETTLAGVESGVPVAVIDNAYNAVFVEYFCREIGPMMDGIVLTGPSSHHMVGGPRHLCQVPPFIEASAYSARASIDRGGLAPERLMTVLGYDEKVQGLGQSLMAALSDADFLFVTPEAAACEEALSHAPTGRNVRARCLAPPADRELFGILQLSRLAVVKYGFMQVTECLALGTPAVVVYHHSARWLDELPDVGKRFTWVTRRSEADRRTIAAAKRFLAQDPAAMAAVHDGTWDAAGRASAFLTSMARSPRTGAREEAAVLGITHERLVHALRSARPVEDVELTSWRAVRARATADHILYIVVVLFRADGQDASDRLWARIYPSTSAALHDYEATQQTETWRQVRYFAPRERIMLEAAVGEARLPQLNP
jgi:hypothetical protein